MPNPTLLLLAVAVFASAPIPDEAPASAPAAMRAAEVRMGISSDEGGDR